MSLFLDHNLEMKQQYLRRVRREKNLRESVKSLREAIAVVALRKGKRVDRIRKAMEDFKQANFTNDQKVIKYSRLSNIIHEETVNIIIKFVSKDLGQSALGEIKYLVDLLDEVKAIIRTCDPLHGGDVKDAIPMEVQADGSSSQIQGTATTPLKEPKTDDPAPQRKDMEAHLSSSSSSISEHPLKRSKTNESSDPQIDESLAYKKAMEAKGKKPMVADLSSSSSSKPHPSLSKPPGSPEYLSKMAEQQRRASAYDELLRYYRASEYELMAVDYNWCAKCTFKPGEVCKGCGVESPPFNWGCRVGIKCHACGRNQHFAPWCDDEEKLRIYRINTDGA